MPVTMPRPRAPARSPASRIGTPLMPTSSANSAALPSMTGSPRVRRYCRGPSTAVPLVTMATVLPERGELARRCGILLDGEAHARDSRGVDIAQDLAAC